MSGKLSIESFNAIRDSLMAPDASTPTILSPVVPAVLPKVKSKAKKKGRNDYKLGILLPDVQCGFRKYEDGEIDPFHDVKALSIAFQIIGALEDEYGVDLIVNLGDFLDLPMFGKYAQENSFYNTANLAFKAGHDILATLRNLAPHSRIVYLEGNHDCRLSRYLTANAQAALGVKQVHSLDPVFSVQHLMRFDDLRIEVGDGYPAEKFWITERLVARHGNVAKTGSTALEYLNKNPMHSTVYGHSHRGELLQRTHDHNGAVQNMAYSPGCLCRVDGAVPSYKGGIKANERPVQQYENWQQGVGLVWYKDSGEFTVEHINILGADKDQRWAVVHGTEFRSIM